MARSGASGRERTAVMGTAQRRKGRDGQSTFKNMLLERDWNVASLTCGAKGEDIIATCPLGKEWSCEVKNTKAITTTHREQAQKQAKERRKMWMLASHIHGTSTWLIQRQGMNPVVWIGTGGRQM